MNMRGKVQLETFGPMTLDELNEQILGYAEGLGMDIELMHSNIEGEVVNALYDAHDRDFDAALINPAGYTTTTGTAIAGCSFDTRQTVATINRRATMIDMIGVVETYMSARAAAITITMTPAG